jgi:hypothetical protein
MLWNASPPLSPFYINKQVKTKRYRIPKGQSKMDNPEKLAT